jgi:SAM-dependent methyltransferase
MPREVFGRQEGRRLFGTDPASYDRARPGHASRVYDVLAERCGLGPGARVLEIGPGTGQATSRLLDSGAEVVALEPDPRLASFLRERFGDGVEVRETTLEEAELDAAAFDLAAAASSFHWVDEPAGLKKIHDALRPGAWVAIWWTLFGIGDEQDAFIEATTPLIDGLAVSPSHGKGGLPFALDSEARRDALHEVGFEEAQHETMRWSASWDTEGIRALYGSFSPIARVDEARRTEILDAIARIAREDFGGRVTRSLQTSLYTARKPG